MATSEAELLVEQLVDKHKDPTIVLKILTEAIEVTADYITESFETPKEGK